MVWKLREGSKLFLLAYFPILLLLPTVFPESGLSALHCDAVRAQPRTPSTLGAHQGTMVTEVSQESLFCFVCSLPVVSLFFISSPFHTSYSLPTLPLSDGFPGTAGMNSDFTVIGEKLTLKTGPWVRTTLGTLFKLLVYF